MNRCLYRFDDYLLDPAARELRHRHRLLPAAPKAFDCLVYLLEHRDRAVGRDELVAAVWGQDEVSDNLLGKTLLKARRLVGDNGDAQACIRTMPRFGYRWVAEVSCEPCGDSATVEPPRPIAPEDPIPAAPPVAAVATLRPAADRGAPPRWRRWIGVAACAGLLLAAAGTGWRAWSSAQRTAVTAPAAAGEAPIAGLVAVLPADVLAGDDWNWLRLGLMDLIAGRLRSAGLAVVPSETMVALLPRGRPGAAEIAAIGRASRAERLVTTRVRQTAEGWRVVFSLATGNGAAREIQIHGSDVIETSQQATERLLAVLAPNARAPAPVARSLTELLQRTEAAVLSEDFGQARTWIETAPEALRQTPELRLRKALIDYRLGRHEQAATELESLLALPSLSPLLHARALMGLGALTVRGDRVEQAEPLFGEALRRLPALGDPINLGYAHLGRAIGRAMRGRTAEATEDFSRARLVLEATGDSLGLARIDMSEGVMEMASGAYASAQPLLERSAERFERLGVPSELGAALGNQIEVHLALLQPAAAQALADRLRAVAGRVENPFEQRLLDARRAAVLAAAGQVEQAERLIDDLRQALDPTRERSLLARLHLIEAELARRLGRGQAQLVAARHAVSLLDAHSREQARARWLAVDAELRIGAVPGPHAAADPSADADRGPAPGVRAYAWLMRAAQRSGEPAREAYEQALQASRDAAPQDRATVLDGYARWLIAEGELEGAGALVGQVARWAEQDFDCALLQVRLYHALGQTEAWRAALSRAQALDGARGVPAELRHPPLDRRVAS